MNLKPYEVFKELKATHKTEMLEITPNDINFHVGTFKTPMEYADFLFKKAGVKVDRFRHDYDSMNTPNPKLGLVFMASDKSTDIMPIVEVWAIIGHNATYIERIQSEHGIK